MSQELIYTSVPSGLKPGSKGFSTVAMTAGLSAAWVDRLESLSGYRPLYPLGDPNASRNPINFAHWRITINAKQRSVLSKVAFAGADYSGRSNKLGHHIVLDPAEQAVGGPAWMMLQPDTLLSAWAGEPKLLPTGPVLPRGDRPPRPCTAWGQVLGDPAWAAVLTESFLTDPAKPVYMIFEPGTDVLALIDESLSLLTPAKRWEVTFSTLFSELPLNLQCAWRAVPAGSPAAVEAIRMGPRIKLVDLTKPPGAKPSGPFAEIARSGVAAVALSDDSERTTYSAANRSNHVAPVAVHTAAQSSLPQVSQATGNRRMLETVLTADEDVIEEFPSNVAYNELDRAKPHSLATKGTPWLSLALATAFAITTSTCSYIVATRAERKRHADERALAEITRRTADSEKQRLEMDTQTRLATVSAMKSESDAKLQSKIDEIRGLNQQLTLLRADAVDQDAKSTALKQENEKFHKEFDAKVLEFDQLKIELKSVREKSTQDSLALSRSPSTAMPPTDTHTPTPLGVSEISIESKIRDDDDDCIITVPTEYKSQKLAEIVWPNNLPTFPTAADSVSFTISQSTTNVGLTVQVPNRGGIGGDNTREKSIFSITLKAGGIAINRCNKSEPLTATELAVLTALDNSIIKFETKDAGQTALPPLSLNRVAVAGSLQPPDNLFKRYNLPNGVSVAKLILTAGDTDWKSEGPGQTIVFARKLSQGNLTAKFSLSLAEEKNGWCLKFQTGSDWGVLIDRQEKENKKLDAAKIEVSNAESLRDLHKDKRDANTFQEAVKEATTRRDQISTEVDALSRELKEWASDYNAIRDLPITICLPNGLLIISLKANPPKLQS